MLWNLKNHWGWWFENVEKYVPKTLKDHPNWLHFWIGFMIDTCVELLTWQEIMVFLTKTFNEKGHIFHIYQLDQVVFWTSQFEYWNWQCVQIDPIVFFTNKFFHLICFTNIYIGQFSQFGSQFIQPCVTIICHLNLHLFTTCHLKLTNLC